MKTRRHSLCIDAGMGMSGDMFAAALIGLGASEDGLVDAMSAAAELLGGGAITVSHQKLPDGSPATQINVDPPPREPLAIADAPAVLERSLRATGVRGGYAGFAHRALAILCQAERTAHAILPALSVNAARAAVAFIGHVRTPYGNRAPYQPAQDAGEPSDAFFIELDPAYSEGLEGLDSFSHLFVLSYLERSCGYSLRVRPPWKSDGAGHGLFSTRSPNRPSPVGLTRVRLRRIDGTRVYTDQLDLFDGTPVLDIKPYIQSIDGPPADGSSFSEEAPGRDTPGNDGWLAGSEHLELHRRGVPHQHPGGGQLHEAQGILLDVVGAAWGLQYLEVDLEDVSCRTVRVGGGTADMTSHGRLPVPAPATRAILDAYDIPYQAGPVEAELLTPSGVSILTALSPAFVVESCQPPADFRVGSGLGQCVFGPAFPNVLRLQCRGSTGTSGHERGP
ncbi:MAG: tRNA (N6-threonylcarbamoyladenosine(37)-N6)-methyltransferase TrmO [Sedimentisphaerales bacterium]|nr:tRNA (N6-threonylcarbamoyladenosine(37)-N6)-methyltransferase TrmO [Sedimentisphaerales bacterium]